MFYFVSKDRRYFFLSVNYYNLDLLGHLEVAWKICVCGAIRIWWSTLICAVWCGGMLSKYEQTTAIWSWKGQVCFYESGQKQRIPFSVLSGRKLRSKNFSWKLLLGFSYRYKNDLICDGTQVNGSMRCKGEATDLGTLIWKPRGILFYNKLSTGWTRLSTLVHPKAISNGFKWLPVACLWKCPWFFAGPAVPAPAPALGRFCQDWCALLRVGGSLLFHACCLWHGIYFLNCW